MNSNTPESKWLHAKAASAHERMLAAAAEEATQRAAGGVEVRVHRVVAAGDERIIARLIVGGHVVRQASVPGDSVQAVGSSVLSLLLSAAAQEPRL